MDSDPEIEIIEKDSGMSSIGDSKDDTPERKDPVCVDVYDVSAPQSEFIARQNSTMLIFHGTVLLTLAL